MLLFLSSDYLFKYCKQTKKFTLYISRKIYNPFSLGFFCRDTITSSKASLYFWLVRAENTSRRILYIDIIQKKAYKLFSIYVSHNHFSRTKKIKQIFFLYICTFLSFWSEKRKRYYCRLLFLYNFWCFLCLDLCVCDICIIIFCKQNVCIYKKSYNYLCWILCIFF